MNTTTATIIIIIATITATLGEFKFTSVPEETPMIITQLTPAHVAYDTFGIVYYVDLKRYYELTNSIIDCITAADSICNKTDDSVCHITAQHHEHMKQILQDDNETLTTFRSKR